MKEKFSFERPVEFLIVSSNKPLDVSAAKDGPRIYRHGCSDTCDVQMMIVELALYFIPLFLG